jgi:type II secretory pathway component PulF
MLLGSGVSILESLRVSKDTLRSDALKRSIEEVRTQVERGSRVHEAMSGNPQFNQYLINIVATGEESGSLHTALLRVAHAYEKDIDGYIKIITTLIEPILVLIIGAIVGVIVISMLLPIFQINVFVS